MTDVNISKLPEEVKNRLRTDIQISTISQCVTELVFNSLDAKSTSIAVRLNLITYRVQVVDNGDGITFGNFENLGKRYMTSKCTSLNEFERKHKMYGYKGESLASLITVSRKVQIISRFKENATYLKTFLNGKEEEVITIKERPSKGTTITIEDFLFNCPVRQNRIKRIDINNIKKILEQLTIIFPGVSFSFRNDETGDIILNTHKEQTVSHILCMTNKSLDIKKFSEIKVVKDNIRLSGMFYMTSSSVTNMQYFFVNKFPVYLDNLQKLVKKSLYQKLDDIFLSESANPVYVMSIQCPYSEVEIYFDSSKYLVEFKSWYAIERCVEKIIKLYIKKYKKQQRHTNSQTSQKTLELDNEDDCTNSPDKPKNSKSKKTLGIRYDFPKGKTNVKDIIENKVKKNVGVRFRKPKKVLQNNSPKSSLNETTSNFVCLANARDNNCVPNKLFGFFDENYDSQNLTLPKLSSENLHVIQHNEKEGKKIIMDNFMKSLPASQEIYEENQNDTILDVSAEHSHQKTSSQNSPQITEGNPIKDISLCIKQQDSIAKKRRLEKLNSVGTRLIEKKIRLQYAVEEEECFDDDITKESQSSFNTAVEAVPHKCDVNIRGLLKQLLEQNLISDNTNQKTNNKKTYICKGTSPLLSYCSTGCQTDNSYLRNECEELGKTEQKIDCQAETRKSLVKFNTIATSPFEFEKQKNEVEKLKNNGKKNSFTYGISSMNNPDMNLFDNLYCPDVKKRGEPQNQLLDDFNPQITKKTQQTGAKDDFLFNFSSANKDVTFESHYFQSPITKLSKPFKKCSKQNTTIVELNSEKLFHNLTFKTPKDYKNNGRVQKSTDDINTSKYFSATKSKEPKKNYNAKVSSVLDTSSFDFQTPDKRPIKKVTFSTAQGNKAFINDSAITFRLFHPHHKSTQKDKDNAGKFNFFESFLWDDAEKADNNLFRIPVETKSKNPVEQNELTSELSFDFLDTNLLNPKQENLFSMRKRIDFVPKGLSPILVEMKVLDITLSPTSKRNLNNAIVKSFENELHLVKWMDYIDKENPKEFFDKLFSEKQKMYEKDIPSVGGEFIKLCKPAQETIINKEVLTSIEIIGQLDNKFIVAGSKTNLFLFDQHAVHERIRLESLYEEYISKNSITNPKFKSTSCNKYIKMTFPDPELWSLNIYKDLFEDIGFEYELHSSYILIRKIPECLHKRNLQDRTDECFYNFVESLLKEEINVLQETRGVRSNIPRLLQQVMSTEACRGAIKFGHQLTNDDCKRYVKMLSKCQLPFQCAHGRPTIYPVLSLTPLSEGVPKVNLRKLLVDFGT